MLSEDKLLIVYEKNKAVTIEATQTIHDFPMSEANYYNFPISSYSETDFKYSLFSGMHILPATIKESVRK